MRSWWGGRAGRPTVPAGDAGAGAGTAPGPGLEPGPHAATAPDTAPGTTHAPGPGSELHAGTAAEPTPEPRPHAATAPDTAPGSDRRVGVTSGAPAAAEPPPGTGTAPVPHGLPETDAHLPRLGFVGAGRVGTALAVALRRAGWPVPAVASRDPARRDRFAALVPGARAYAEPQAVLDQADLVFLTVPDDAVAEVAVQMRLYSGQAIVHTSGVLPSSVLAPAMAAGTEAGSFHPLVAFAGLEAALAALPGSVIAIEGDEPLLPLLSELAEALGARPVRMTAAGKALHHAAAVLAAGGLVALLDTIRELGVAAGLDDAAALDTYLDLARQGLDHAGALGTQAALTGPVVRGDLGTLRAHLGALQDRAPDALPVYVALVRRAVAMAMARGDLPADRAAAVLALLAALG